MEFNVLEAYLGKKVEICENMIFLPLYGKTDFLKPSLEV